VAFNADGRAVSSMGADFRDLDNDGWEDIFLTALSHEGFSFFRNLSRGQFADIGQAARVVNGSLGLSGWSVGAYDFNNDGWKDLLSANGHALTNSELVSSGQSRQVPSIFLNRGDGTFAYSPAGQKALWRGAAFADLNRDGKIDAVLTRLNEPPVILTNISDNRNHWLQIQLRGNRSNRDGIGARIQVVTDSGSQWNHATTAVGYGGSSQPGIHFGLGNSTIVKTIEIFWPSGIRQVFRDAPVDRRMEVEEQAPRP
jgi:hypothetical protein